MEPRTGSTTGCLRRRLFVPDAPEPDEGPDGPRTFDWLPLDEAPSRPAPPPRRLAKRGVWMLGFALALMLSVGAGGAALVGAGVAGGAVAWTLLGAPADGARTATWP